MGAPKACGVNREEVEKHLKAAMQGWREEEEKGGDEEGREEGREEGMRKAVREAWAFCEEEGREVEVWKGRVEELKEKIVLPPLPPFTTPPPPPPPPPPPAAAAVQQQLHNKILKRLKAFLRSLRVLSSRLSSFFSSLLKKARGEKEGEGGREEGVWLNGKKIKSIPAVRIESKEVLMEKYMKKNTPCVITNFQEGFGGGREGGREGGGGVWTHAGLSEMVGEEWVRVSLSATGRFDGPEEGGLWGEGGREEEVEEVLVRPPQTTMRMDDFLSLLRLSQANPSLAPNASFYLEYLSLTQYLGPYLLPFLPLPPPAAAAVAAAGEAWREGGLELLLTNLWVGKGGTTSPLHYDDYENILCQLKGEKTLVLFPPMDTFHLYYTTRVKGEMKYVYPDTFERVPLREGGNKAVFGSSVFLDQPDLERHPEVVKAVPYRVSLKEGECLYLPAYWHHEVKSFPDGAEGLNVAVNYWFKNVTHFEKEGAGLAAATRAEKERRRRRRRKEEVVVEA